MRWFIGTSGWSYAEWRGRFYPPDVNSRDWLRFYARYFNAVEINNSFYHPPDAARLQKWEKTVPKDFTFALKGWRLITHLKKLKDAEVTVPQFMQPFAKAMQAAPLIFQLPPGLEKDVARLKAFLSVLPKSHRCVIEFRNQSWHDDEVYNLLRKHNVAFCLYEIGDNRSPWLTTADFSYVRLHGRIKGYKGNYSRQVLQEWRDWLQAQNQDAYMFFDNTAEEIHVIDNARMMQTLTQSRKLAA